MKNEFHEMKPGGGGNERSKIQYNLTEICRAHPFLDLRAIYVENKTKKPKKN